jgi:predicted acyl esterase
MRDGIKLYLDVFRPKSSDQDKVPAIIAWSPYGKAGSAWTLDLFVHRMGIPVDRTSGYESWEAPDPADWCQRGYAVVNVDARGSGWSEGTLFSWGSQEAEDIHDTVAYLSQQPWCNGSVTMAGNSYLAKAQIVAASRNPHPALKAIAPWEGFTDTYNDMFLRGGFPSHQTFANMFLHAYAGTGEAENIPAMVKLHPLYDDYWEDKAEKVENIDIPIYALGSFSNPFHTRGSFHIFRKAKSDKKWLRIMPNFEWYDLYQRESNNDLQRFYDRYCKGIMNGWEHDTPPLRLSLIGCEGSVPNITERHEKEFPLQRQQLKTFFLDGATKTLVDTPLKTQATVAHEAHSLDASSVGSSFVL